MLSLPADMVQQLVPGGMGADRHGLTVDHAWDQQAGERRSDCALQHITSGKSASVPRFTPLFDVHSFLSAKSDGFRSRTAVPSLGQNRCVFSDPSIVPRTSIGTGTAHTPGLSLA